MFLLDAIRENYSGPTLTAFGVLTGVILFGASLTPSLMPRDPVMQGLLGGVVAALGYGFGLAVLWLYQFMELPMLPNSWRPALKILLYGSAAVIGIYSLSHAADWQNSTRSVMGLDPVATAHPWTVAAVSLGVFLVLWISTHFFGFVLYHVNEILMSYLPTRTGMVIGTALVLWLFWAVIDGALVRTTFKAADKSFETADTFFEPDIPQPTDPKKTGSTASLVDWQEMGRWGRHFVSKAPTKKEISEFATGEIKEPVRVYVGRRSADSPRERAELALQELIRTGGFERSALVVVVPVGTGWLDPGGHDTLEFMLGGDVATVAVQYSYLTSGLSLLSNPEYGVQQARELFDVIYHYWTELPKDTRPKLYVHGLSQGALNSQLTLPLLDVLGDPINGAVWTGSPFLSPFWQDVRTSRQPDSPAWRPRYGNGSLVRVVNQTGGWDVDGATWGPIRIVFLHYGSDPIVAFTFDTAFRRPDWLNQPRAPDVSPDLRWFPVVTMLQIALDMMISLDIPRYGHYYIAPDYIDAWASVTDPPDWSDEQAEKLKKIFASRGPSF